jgi:hypothetical protein
MSDIAIRVENLGKRYRIGKRERYKPVRDTVANGGLLTPIAVCAGVVAAESIGKIANGYA